MGAQRRVLAAAVLALSAAASSANEVEIRLERVPLYQLSRVVLGELLNEPYVLDGALIAADDVATLDMRRIAPSEAREVLAALLRARGFVLERQAGVTIVKREERRTEESRLFIYRPRYRSVSYLQGALRSFVPNGRFAGVGQAQSPQPSAPAPAKSAPPAAPAPAQSAVSAVVPAQGPVLASQDVLVFEGSEAEVAKLKQLVDDLDRAAREVIVKAYVLEVGSSVSDGSAVSLAVNLLGGRLSAGLPAARLPNVAALQTGGIELAFSVLQSDSRFKVVSSPTLRIRSGEHAKLSVGSEVPVLGAVSMSTAGQPVQSVEYRSSGVILDLRPEVLREMVYLAIEQQVSSFVATTTGVNNSPTLLKRDLTTNLGVRPGEVILMGGLEEVRSAEAHSGLPGFLSFFGSRASDRSRSELILMLEAITLAE